jgi:zinc protease
MPSVFRILVLAGFAWCLPAVAAIPIQNWTMPSGVQVFLVESQSIAMVDMQIDFDAGARRDPQSKSGLASVTAAMASKGVTAAGADPALDENALSEAWADLGASFRASASADRMGFYLRSLTFPDLLGKVVALAARQIGQPAFPQAIWLRERERIAASAHFPAPCTGRTPMALTSPGNRCRPSVWPTCRRCTRTWYSPAAPRCRSWAR